MRIAFIVGSFPALSETFILNQITGLIDRGHEVDIYAIYARAETKMHADIMKYNLLERTYYKPSMPENKLLMVLKGLFLAIIVLLKNPNALFNSLNIFKHGKKAISLHLLYGIVPFIGHDPYNIIHAHFGPNGLRAVKLKQIGVINGKLITTFHGHDVNTIPMLHGDDYYSELFLNLDLCTVSSNFMGEKVLKLGLTKDKLEKLPVGVNLKLFSSRKERRNNKSIEILSVGRLVESKGIEDSIKAIAKILPHFPNINYKIVGDGELKENLKTLIQSLGISENVLLMGGMNQEELTELYDQADIFLLSSVRATDGAEEGQGVVLLEAQAMGIPVVSTNIGGIPESLINGKSGYLVPERDVQALEKKLRYLIEHPETWKKMGQDGRTFVETKYDIDMLNDKLVKIYERVINEKY